MTHHHSKLLLLATYSFFDWLHEQLDFTTYVLNLGWDKPTDVLAVGVCFLRNDPAQTN